MCYPQSKVEANDLQIKASDIAPNMLQTAHVSYSKLSAHENQSSNVLKYLSQFSRVFDFKLHLENILNDLQFSPDIHASKFERSFCEVGKLIGYHSQEPEFEYGNGPDVLWCMNDHHFLILEAKSRATHKEITRDNVGQLLQSGEWFKTLYGNTADYTLVTIQSTNLKGWNVNPGTNSKVINDDSLDRLRKHLQHFSNGIVNRGTLTLDKIEISKLLSAHHFTPSQFRQEFLRDIASKKS